ncbi:MAG: acyl-CoA thioesterase [Bacteroidales bacterium]|nr:acyl-CoA thioesterase [Bacteroidales bacterium]MBQ2912084.1 acyl-CoA thioesterase [Bacteroidales bacterium]MBQ7017692.1 acyl-CoA thioesterase [Bacteroidales bacterium]MBR2477515.1 acyl-CoA thioesterase [Bacteroidales bacterium]
MIQTECTIDVRYYETDLMGIVHHSNYIRYFEYGRIKMLEEIGLPISEIEGRGVMLPVVSTFCTYKTPSRMGETLRIISSVESMPMAKMKIKTRIVKESSQNPETLPAEIGATVAEGEVVIGFIKADTRRPCRIPDYAAEIMQKYF